MSHVALELSHRCGLHRIQQVQRRLEGRHVGLFGTELDFSRPGKPTDNAMVESLNGRLRQECLNELWFMSLTDAQVKIEAWRRHYNEARPDSALDWRTPLEFARQTGPRPGLSMNQEPQKTNF